MSFLHPNVALGPWIMHDRRFSCGPETFFAPRSTYIRFVGRNLASNFRLPATDASTGHWRWISAIV